MKMRRLGVQDIEMVRQHRNSNFVRQYMEYREEITPEMQLKWFHSINNNNNLYLLTEYKGDPIGLINARNIQWEKRTAEGGIFFWDKRYINSPVALLAALTFGELAANVFHLKAVAKIMVTNKRAIRYNKMLGFELCEGQENKINQLYSFSGERFMTYSRVFRGFLVLLYGTNNIVVEVEQQDYQTGFGQMVDAHIDMSKIDKVEPTELGGKRYHYQPHF